MRVKLFWKNHPPSPNELYMEGVLKRLSFRNTKELHERMNAALNRNVQRLEDELNTWLSQNPNIKIVDIKQSGSGGSMSQSLWLISVWYEEAT